MSVSVVISLVLLMFGVVVCVVRFPRPCGRPGETVFHGYCYTVLDSDLLSWEDAEIACNKWFNGSKLASIHSQSENDFVTQLYRKHSIENYWLGLFRNTDGVKFWNDGSDVDFVPTNPHRIEESSIFSEKRCYYVSDLPWKDDSCTEKRYPSCKYKIPFCYGVIGSNLWTSCHGYGSCVELDKCICDSNSWSSRCEKYECQGYYKTDERGCVNVAGGVGKCIGPDLCNCPYPWWGKFCGIQITHPSLSMVDFVDNLVFPYYGGVQDWNFHPYPPRLEIANRTLRRDYCRHYFPKESYDLLGTYPPPECHFTLSADEQYTTSFVVKIFDVSRTVRKDSRIKIRTPTGGKDGTASLIVGHVDSTNSGQSDGLDSTEGSLEEDSSGESVGIAFGVLAILFGIALYFCLLCFGCCLVLVSLAVSVPCMGCAGVFSVCFGCCSGTDVSLMEGLLCCYFFTNEYRKHRELVSDMDRKMEKEFGKFGMGGFEGDEGDGESSSFDTEELEAHIMTGSIASDMSDSDRSSFEDEVGKRVKKEVKLEEEVEGEEDSEEDVVGKQKKKEVEIEISRRKKKKTESEEEEEEKKKMKKKKGKEPVLEKKKFSSSSSSSSSGETGTGTESGSTESSEEERKKKLKKAKQARMKREKEKKIGKIVRKGRGVGGKRKVISGKKKPTKGSVKRDVSRKFSSRSKFGEEIEMEEQPKGKVLFRKSKDVDDPVAPVDEEDVMD